LPISDVLRDDVSAEGLTAEQALANAPAVADDHFRVPAVLDPGAGA
jgi:aspartyl/glutamyl-tRNA(Asn/Gln) amidotransferase C subunit